MVSSTIARWLKSILTSAGVDTSIFFAHSIRGAAATAASMAGITTQQVLATADWSSASTFRQFSFRGDRVQSHHRGFTISSLSASKSCCDMEPELSEVQS